jgi:hypothetical protein
VRARAGGAWRARGQQALVVRTAAHRGPWVGGAVRPACLRSYAARA